MLLLVSLMQTLSFLSSYVLPFLPIQVFLFTCQDPLKQLKDLTQLKNQLEEIQRRVENEISAGIPQVSGFHCGAAIINFL